jgi:lipoyl(octanoyl) transferase
MNRICRVQNLGRQPYQRVWDYQKAIATEIAVGAQEDTLLILEHNHTYTLGSRGQAEHLLWSEEKLKAEGVDVVWVDRGGDITYHGPGQIVVYPIIRLAPLGWQSDRLPQADYVGYIRMLEEVIISSLADYNIDGEVVSGKTGVWVNAGQHQEPEKIASIGVKVDVRGVSRHGFALNVDPDMKFWHGIVPCGISDVKMTSMANVLSQPLELDQVTETVIRCFGEVFKMKMVTHLDD